MVTIADVGEDFTTASPFECTLFHKNQHLCDVILAVKRVTASFSIIGCFFMITVICFSFFMITVICFSFFMITVICFSFFMITVICFSFFMITVICFSFFMITVIWLFRKYAIFTQRLIMCLSIAALLNSIFYVLGGLQPDGAMCDFQAWGQTYFDWTVLLWVCCITFNLYWNVVRMKPSEQFERYYHIIAWCVPLGISLLPFIGNHYGPAGMWCWIVNDWKWRFGIWFCPLFIIIGILFFVYIYLIYTVNKKVKNWEGLYDPDVEHSKAVLKEDVKPLRAYPFVYLVVSLFPLINRIQNAVSDESVFFLVLMHVLCSPLQGALNAIVFGLDKDTRSRLTISQIKAMLQARADRSTIREFPIAHSSCELPRDDSFSSVSYSRLH
ncbi:hypothetical protein LSAT2_030832 [Lamellibrachia satsuma]|nr:hypothetical protein LSAT2_030832 [Lamellibrachia satsuma]